MANKIDGLHVILDGLTENVELFNSENLTKMMEELVDSLNMKIIFGPKFLEVELEPEKLTGDSFQDDGGITGFCVISTSHISAHCWQQRKTFMLDIFSCKSFDSEKALQVVQKYLKPFKTNITRVYRDPLL